MQFNPFKHGKRAFLRRWVWLPLAAALLVIHVAAWPLAWKVLIPRVATPLRHQFQVLTYPSPRFTDGPRHIDNVDTSCFQLGSNGQSLLASGLWNAPRSGLYRFRLTGDEKVQLFLDRQELHFTPSTSPGQSDCQFSVEEGKHLLVTKLPRRRGSGRVDLELRAPGEWEYRHIQGEPLIGLQGTSLVAWWLLVAQLGMDQFAGTGAGCLPAFLCWEAKRIAALLDIVPEATRAVCYGRFVHHVSRSADLAKTTINCSTIRFWTRTGSASRGRMLAGRICVRPVVSRLRNLRATLTIGTGSAISSCS